MSSIKAASTPAGGTAAVCARASATSSTASATKQPSRACHDDRARPAIASLRPAADRRLVGQRGVPGKMDPRILRHLGDIRIDQRPSLRLGIDGGEMCVGHQRAYQLASLAGVEEVIDVQQPLDGDVAKLCQLLPYHLEVLS